MESTTTSPRPLAPETPTYVWALIHLDANKPPLDRLPYQTSNWYDDNNMTLNSDLDFSTVRIFSTYAKAYQAFAETQEEILEQHPAWRMVQRGGDAQVVECASFGDPKAVGNIIKGQYNGLKKKELQDILVARGLGIGGTNPDLIKRIEGDDRKKAEKEDDVWMHIVKVKVE